MKRNSFILHTDSLDILSELTDEQAGALFKAISEYQRSGESSLEGIMKALFIPFKNQFDRDNEKYQKICERNKANGLGGGRPKSKETQSVTLDSQSNPEKPYNDSKNENENVVTIVTNRFDFFWSNFPPTRKGSKSKAESAYKSALKRDTEENILSGLKSYAESDEVSRGYAKGAAAWLNDDRWTSNYSRTPQGEKKTYSQTILSAKDKAIQMIREAEADDGIFTENF